jgi:hypothetical protein
MGRNEFVDVCFQEVEVCVQLMNEFIARFAGLIVSFGATSD